MNVVGHSVNDHHSASVVLNDAGEVGVEFALPSFGDEWESVFCGEYDVVDQARVGHQFLVTRVSHARVRFVFLVYTFRRSGCTCSYHNWRVLRTLRTQHECETLEPASDPCQ